MFDCPLPDLIFPDDIQGFLQPAQKIEYTMILTHITDGSVLALKPCDI